MGFFDDLARAAAQGGFHVQGFGGAGYEPVWSQLKPWFARISTNGVMRWLPRAASQIPCQIPDYDQGVPVGPCRHVSLESCLGCGRPVCLNHAFIDANGEAICYLCAVHLPNQKDPRAREYASPRPASPPPPPPPDPAQEARVKSAWARTQLGVQEGVPWETVRKQHRTLSAKYHPDKQDGDEQRFKDVQNAYDWLKKVYGEN